jgi:predicted dehydrogenase
MSTTVRLGIIGLTHDHIWDHLPDVLASNRIDLALAAETNSALCENLAGHTDCPTRSSWQELVESGAVDAVYIYSDNRSGSEAAVAALQEGLHVMIEKPMAADYASACQMHDAAVASDAKLMINWPFCWWPQMQEALRRLDDGIIGRVWQVKYRAAHAGPAELGCSDAFCDWLFDEQRNGGGAMMDYCCYGTTLARTILGLPDEVVGISGQLCKDHLTVDDNAIIVMRGDKTMATAEASWSQIGKLTSYTTAIYGTEGTLMIEPRHGGQLLLATADDPNGSPLAVAEQVPSMKNATEHFLHHIDTSDDLLRLCQSGICRDSQEILEAGRRSMKAGATVLLPLCDS